MNNWRSIGVLLKKTVMEIYQVELLEPKAVALLESLSQLKLIRFEKLDSSMEALRGLLERQRAKGGTVTSSQEMVNETAAINYEKINNGIRRPRFGSAKGMFIMAPDFDEPEVFNVEF